MCPGYRSTSQTRVSASQATTPRTGTMSSRDLRAARAARSARSTSPAKLRSTLKNGTEAPPLQTRSLQTFQMSTDDLASGRAAPVTRQHTLPSVSRKRSQASAELRKSVVDDFHCEYDYARQSSDKIATVTPDNELDFAVYRRDNLSQDSYRVSDSRDSSVDRLEMRTKLDVEAEFAGTEPLDEAKLILKLEQEQQLQESRNMEEQNADDSSKLQLNDDVHGNDDERAINGEDVHVIKAEWDLPESCLQTEVEKIISIETTRIVETVETTRVTPVTETYRRQKRLSRENAVRVIDEDMLSSPTETETCAVDTTDVPEPEFAVPMSIDQDEIEHIEITTNQEKIRSFIVSLIDDAVKKTADEMKGACAVEEIVTTEPTELNLTVTEKSESAFSATDDIKSPVEEVQEQSLRVTAEDRFHDDTLTLLANSHHKPETENELEGSEKSELSGQNSEDTAESQITVVEVEASDAKQETTAIDETSDKRLDADASELPEEAAQQSPTDVEGPSQEVLKTMELPNDTWAEDALSSDICRDVADQHTEEATSAVTDAASNDKQTALNQTLTSCETERQDITETTPVDSAEVYQQTTAQSDQLPDEIAEPEPAAKTSEDIPYVLHKRHIIPAVEKSAGDTRIYATLPSRHHPSRSRSLSPGHKKPAILTSEQKRVQMMKVKASLVSMAAEMAAPWSPKSPVGIGAPTKRIFDFVVCSRLPPRDSFSSRDDTLSPPDEPDITVVSRGKKVSSTDEKPADNSEIKSLELLDTISVEAAEKADYSESEPAGDSVENVSTSEPFQLTTDSPSIEIITTHEQMSLNINEIEGTDREKVTTEVEKLQTPEGLESESESESKPLADEAATPELEDEVNRILSESELHVAAEDNGSLASGVSGKFTDESPDVETSRDLEASSRTCVISTEDGATIPLSLSITAESAEKPLLPPSPCIETDSGHVAESLPAEVEVQPPATSCSLQAQESHEFSAVDQAINGDYQQNDADATAHGGVTVDDATRLAEAEQRLLLELQANDLAASADNISSSSHSLNDQLDAEVLQSFPTALPAVDAACRLSESSADGPAPCGFGRNVHLLDWLEEQAQLRGVSVSPHGAEGHSDAAISDEDDVEHGVFEDNLQDIFAALEAEVMANPFLVPITPQTSDMCVNAMTSERLSFEDDSSFGVLEASGGVGESTCGVDAHREEAFDEESKHIGAVGITGVEGNIRHSQLSLSISSEGDVCVEYVNDLSDPLEVLEIESRAMLPPQLRSNPVCLSSDSESLSDKCRREEKLEDVGDVLDRVDESRRLSISDLDDDEQLLTAGVRRAASDTSSSDPSVGVVCVEEEPDAFAVLEEADNSTAGAAAPRRSNSDEGDEDVHSVSSSSAVDSDPAALGNFVEKVMLHHSAESDVLDGNNQTTDQQELSTELDGGGQHLHARQATDDDTSRSEYTLTPSCETEISLTVAQEAQLKDVFELPQGAETFTDTAISDEDDVEQNIEDSLQDVFAALEAEVLTKRYSVTVIPQTLIVIGQNSFSDDEEEQSDLLNKSAHCELETASEEFTGDAVSKAGTDAFLRADDKETQGTTDEHVDAKDSERETADADINLHPLPADVSEFSKTAALEERRAISADDGENETFQRGTPELTVRDDTVQRETVWEELDAAQMSRDSSVVLTEAADRGDTEGIRETEISHATEKFQIDSKSTEVENVEASANENVTSETHSSDDENVNTSEYAVKERSTEESVKNTSTEDEAVETGCSDDRTEPCTSAGLVSENVEQLDVVTGAEQSQHVS